MKIIYEYCTRCGMIINDTDFCPVCANPLIETKEIDINMQSEINEVTQGCVLWFTGLPCSGKTTIADRLAKDFKKLGMKVERLDGDIVRKCLTKDLGFSKEDRATNLERVSYVADLLARNGVMVLCTFVSPYRDARKKIRDTVHNYIEIFVDCPVNECEERDVKGMYKLAREGKIKDFTGVDDPYEQPECCEIVVFPANEAVWQSCNHIKNKLEEFGYL